MHPSLRQFAAQDTLAARSPLLQHGDGDRHEPGDAKLVANGQSEDFLVGTDYATKSLGKSI
jgi:hypothetical protein